MVKSHRRAFPDKYRAAFLSVALLLISLLGYSQTYSPGSHVTVNDAIGPAQAVPVDSRSMFYDGTNFLYRPYQNTSEVLSYLNLARYRAGNFIIVVDSGGTLLPNGHFSNGHNNFYMFADSTGNANLVRLNLFGSSGTCAGCLLAANNLTDLASIPTSRATLLINNVDNTSDATKNSANVTITNHIFSGLSNTFTNIPNSALSNNSIGLSITSNPAADISVTTTPAALGASLVANFPNGSATQRGPIIPVDWSAFHLKEDSIHISNDSVYRCVNGTCTFQTLISGGGGSGTVTNFTAGNLSPLFTSSVATSTTTPALTFTLSTAAANSVFGNNTGSTAAPTYFVPNSTTLNGWFGGAIQGALTLTTTGSSGAATLIGNTLNIPVYSTGSGGNPNSNIGAGYRWAIPFTNNIKTAFGNTDLILDSTTNANAITFTPDTTTGNVKLATQGFTTRTFQPIGNYVTGGTGDVVFTGPGSVPATIQANAVTTSKINNNAVTLGKMAVNTVNTLLGYDGSGNAADITFSTTGTSGAATLTGSNLNIPQYQGAGNYITALTGDVVATGPGSVGATIQPNVVTYTKIQAAAGQGLMGATGAGNFGLITLGTNLSMSGSVLNASGGGGGGLTIPNLSWAGNISGSSNTSIDTLYYRDYNIQDFGMFPGTDIAPKLNALIASFGTAGARIHIPAGSYNASDSIRVYKNVIIYGDGMIAYKLFSVNLTPFIGATVINFTSATKNGFVLDTDGSTNVYPMIQLRDMAIVNTAGSTPTAGSGIFSKGGKQNKLDRLVVQGFYTDITVQSNNLIANDVACVAPVQYGMICTSILNPDAGGTELHHCHFYSGFLTTTTAIGLYWKGGGLLYADYCDWNAQGQFAVNTEFIYGIYATLQDGPTSLCKITNCMFENLQTTAMYMDNLSGGRLSNMQLHNIEIGPYSTSPDAGIVIKGWYNVQYDQIVGINNADIPHCLVRLIADTTVQIGGLILPASRFGSQHGYNSPDSVYSGEDIQRVPLLSQIPGVALGPNILGIRANPNGIAGDSQMVQIPISSFTPSMGTFNNAVSFTNGGSWSGYVFTLGAADATHPGLMTTGAQTFLGAKIFHTAIMSDSVVFGSAGSAGAYISIGAANGIPGTATGTNLIQIGTGALHLNSTGSANIAIGPSALATLTTASFNTAMGSSAGTALTSSDNSLYGYQTMVAANTGGDNSAFGFKALNASTGAQNAAFGSKTALGISTGASDAAFGYGALTTATTASFNTAFGALALATNVSGNHTMGLGYEAGYYETRSNKFIIGDNITTYLMGGDFSTGQVCFNANTTGTNLFSLTTGALVEFRGTTGGWLPNQLNTTNQTALTTLTGNTFYNTDSNRLVYYTGSKYIGYATTDQLGSAGVTPPFSDANTLIKNSSDATKLGKFDVSGVTTGTTRTYFLPDANTTLVGSNQANSFSAKQTFTNATTSNSSINLSPSSANPTSPNSGDLWWNSPNLYFYNGTTNIDLLAQYPKAKGDLTGQTAAATITTYSVTGSGSFNTFRVGGYLTVTAVSLDVIQLQVTYTDETSTSRTQSFFVQGATTGISTTGANGYSPMDIRVKQGTTITVATVLTTGTGSITYDAGASITQLY